MFREQLCMTQLHRTAPNLCTRAGATRLTAQRSSAHNVLSGLQGLRLTDPNTYAPSLYSSPGRGARTGTCSARVRKAAANARWLGSACIARRSPKGACA